MTNPLGFIEGIGGPELLMIMFVVLLLFGANKLPELARGMGKSVREFKKAASGVEEQIKQALEDEAPPPPPQGPVVQPPLPKTNLPPYTPPAATVPAKPTEPSAPPPPAPPTPPAAAP